MIKVYVDTSVFGGCFDAEFEEWSNKLLEEFKLGLKVVVISDLTLKELEAAPANVNNLVEEIPEEHKEYVILNDESRELARHYIEGGVVSEGYLVDAQHIAIATVSRVDILVSWNFRHIVNLTKIRLYNSVNLKYGYPLLEIRSPREVLYER
ncbi:type II toxin-antitoxin system VapC family toxin [Dehalococcoidia bacterium]|nr:type II toxin-antitoxin system VapC family toxin [Dehalococcoidia bacterium]MCL0102975.1 type II toxin-antitoxin system VapC family toxin [Dehalococcoidia bacterium]